MGYKAGENIEATGEPYLGNQRAYDRRTGQNGHVEYDNLGNPYFHPDEDKRTKTEQSNQSNETAFSDIVGSGYNKLSEEASTIFSARQNLKDFKSSAKIAIAIIVIAVFFEIITFGLSIVSMTITGFPVMLLIYIGGLTQAETVDFISIIQGFFIVFEIVLFISYIKKIFQGKREKYPLKFGIINGVIHFVIFFLMGVGITDSIKYSYQMIALPLLLLIIFTYAKNKKMKESA